ncbi:putative toxin [Nocardia salmonicida]|uniref:putative toxin n=1 Tax=Nocardia salmonicida TaxID=53431 RepID=UPI003404361E
MTTPGSVVVKIDPAAYYAAAARLAQSSRDLEAALRALDGNLDVARSAGVHEAGVRWSSSYDQSASDVFELASLSAIAAGELARQVHQLGVNHESNESATNPNQSGANQPAVPSTTQIADALHPKQISAGGTGDRPAHWDKIADKVTKKWPDCDFTRIKNAGAKFQEFGQNAEDDATTMFNEVKTHLYDQTATDIDAVLEEVALIATAYRDAGSLAKALRPTCTEVSEKSDTERQQVQAILNSLVTALVSLDVTGAAPAGKAGDAGYDVAKDALLRQAATDFDTLMVELDGFVAAAINSNTGIYTTATTSARLLTGIMERTPRNTDPIHNGDTRDSGETGQQGEDRAGVPRGSKEEVVVNGRVRIPDHIDDQLGQVTEVKNKNKLDKADTEQITDMVDYANGKGYSPILVTDHRTTLTPDVQKLVDEGKITLIRKELDDNADL